MSATRSDTSAARSASPIRSRPGRSLALILVAVAAIGAGLFARGLSLFEGAELAGVDTRMKVRGDVSPPDDLVLVALDDKTLGRINRRYPYPRSYHGEVIDRLTDAGAAAIAYDVEFASPSAPREDRALFQAIKRASPIVIASNRKTEGGQPVSVFGAAAVRRVGGDVASTSLFTESDGKVRRFDSEQEGIVTFPVAVARKAGVPAEIPPPGGAPSWIDYRGPPGTFPAHSFSDVMYGKVDPSEFDGKTVFVGGTDPGLKDLHGSPPRGQQMPGVEIFANAVATIQDGYSLRQAIGAFNVFALILLGGLAPLLALRISAGWAAAVGAAALTAFLIAAQIAFDQGRIVEVTYPAFACILGLVGSGFVEGVTSSRERWRTRGIFSRYMDPTVVRMALADGGGQLRSRELEATVLFCDLRGFTAFSEHRPPGEVVGMLNLYLDRVGDAVRREGGTIISFLGDGVMTVFGAPVELDDHADRAVRAARSIVMEQLEYLRNWARERDPDFVPEVGVGLASGTVVSGGIGGGWRQEYTVTGDPTNLAAKLQGLSEQLGSRVLLDQSVIDRLSPALKARAKLLGRFDVGGRSRPASVWTLGSLTA